MSTSTTNLGLFKYDIQSDGDSPFSITDALNNNWDKIDANTALKNHTHSNYVSTSSLSEAQCVVETYINGTEWYRVWSDGWCEQGGLTTAGSSSTKTITLLQSYRDSYYTVLFGNMYTTTATASSQVKSTTKTASSFDIIDSTTTTYYTYWYTCGYKY